MSKHTPPTWAWVRGHGLMQMRDGICVAPVLHATYEPSIGAGIVVSETHARLIEAAPGLLAERDALAAAFGKLGAVLRVNMLRAALDVSHADIDAAIDACLGPTARAALAAAAKGNAP